MKFLKIDKLQESYKKLKNDEEDMDDYFEKVEKKEQTDENNSKAFKTFASYFVSFQPSSFFDFTCVWLIIPAIIFGLSIFLAIFEVHYLFPIIPDGNTKENIFSEIRVKSIISDLSESIGIFYIKIRFSSNWYKTT
jgi:hypothetical protein